MSIFREEVKISNPSNPKRLLRVQMIVDSGATYNWLPAEVLLKLGITPVVKRKLKLANGNIVEKDVGIIDITVKLPLNLDFISCTFLSRWHILQKHFCKYTYKIYFSISRHYIKLLTFVLIGFLWNSWFFFRFR